MLAKIVRSAQEIVVQQRAGPAHIDDHGVKSIEIELDLAELVELAGRQVEHRQRRPARKRRERRFVGCDRSEEHTSELQSLMRISYAVFCLKKQKQAQTT